MVAQEVLVRAARLPPLPTISEILRMYHLRALKQLSQNFLLDERLNNKLVNCGGRIRGFEICEIGPGPGNLTRSILNKGAEKVILVEKDNRFIPCLEMLKEAASQPVDIHMRDVMTFDMGNIFSESKRKAWDDVFPDIQVVGNLPFQLSTALIIKYLRAISEKRNAWSYGRVRMTFTFQKEVAERIEATVMSAQRCRLSVMCQNWCVVQHRLDIPGAAFTPPPKVDVGVVHFKPRTEPIIDLPFDLVEKVVFALFRFRQKYFVKGLKTLFPQGLNDTLVEEMMKMIDVSAKLRPFQLSLDEIGQICEAYKTIIDKSPKLYNFTQTSKKDDWISKEKESEMNAEQWKKELVEDEFY